MLRCKYWKMVKWGLEKEWSLIYSDLYEPWLVLKESNEGVVGLIVYVFTCTWAFYWFELISAPRGQVRYIEAFRQYDCGSGGWQSRFTCFVCLLCFVTPPHYCNTHTPDYQWQKGWFLCGKVHTHLQCTFKTCTRVNFQNVKNLNNTKG